MSGDQIAIVPAKVVEEFAALVPVLAEQVKALLAQHAAATSSAKLYSVAELAGLWSMEPGTVRRHLKNYGIKTVKFTDGRSARFKAADIDNLIKKLAR
jgi:hypothetical protein